ncbi:mRNA-decapping enzyme subunit 2 [Sticta canariensis]|nr:mRNA-decapping enzyme subunit 2 [Sticta canariensis]
MTETKMQLVDWLDDLCVRFIINLPHEELESVERICFQVEEAQWFYEDFIRPLDPDLPSLNLKNFCLRIFQHCPLLSEFSSYHHSAAFSEFLAYKTRVPVRGAIMLNQEMDQVVLVKGWKKSANWSFPRGKINKDEPDLECAIREVYEETGFHLRDAGMVGNDEDMKYIEVTMREQHMRLYVFRGVPMDAHFEPRTRKEISKIQWYKLSELPTLKKQKQQQEGRGEDLAVTANKFYMVAPFMVPLKKWIAQRKKMERRNARSQLSTTSMKTNGNVATPEKTISYSTSHDSPPTPDELDGIVAKLRQSDQAKPCDLSEALEPPMSAQEASAHLKSLLHVPPNTVENNSSSAPNVSETLNPGALLALLQPAGPTEQDNSSQTPLVKVPGTTVSPLVPNKEHTSLESSSMHTLPVMHSISNQQNNSQSMPHSSFHSTNSTKYPPTQPMVMHQPSQAVRQLQPSIHRDTQQTHFGPQMPPPYLRTGDPDFAQNSQIPGIHTTSVPPANKLPRPNLTTHSSALLNLFKNTQPLEVKAADSFSGTESSAMQSKENARTSEVLSNGKKTQISARDETLPLALPPIVPSQDFLGDSKSRLSSPHTKGSRLTQQHQDRVVMPGNHFPADRTKIETVDERFESQPSTPTLTSNISAKLRSEHQDTLLGLFRKTPVSEVAEPGTLPTHSSPALSTQTLEPPSTVVELSAMPSPAHSRQAFHVKTKPPTLGSGGIVNGPSRIPTTPVTTLRPKSPPLSATVNGPLNVPQFQMLASNSRSRAGKGKPPNKHPVPPRRSPVTIIARPAGDRDPKSIVKQKASVISDKPLEKPSLITTDLRSPSSNAVMMDTNPKLKQPQILRRPGPVLRASEDLAVPSPIQPLPSPKLDSRFNSGKNQSKEHKSLLLALFSKPSPLTTPTTLNSADVISPLSEKNVFRRTQSPAVPTTATRSRMGSLTSAIGEGSKKTGSGIQTPRITPADRTFLLGYLEKVAKGERR